MSSVFSGSLSGNFVSTNTPVFIELPTGFDRIEVENQTVTYAGGVGSAAQFLFVPATMPNGQGTKYVKEGTIGALVPSQIPANLGFFVQDTTINEPGSSIAITSISNATPPVVATGNTAGLIANSTMVRIFATGGAQQLGGIDFTVGTVMASTSFTLAYMAAIVTAGGPGTYRVIPFDPYIYPSTRTITKIVSGGAVGLSNAVSVITLSVTNNYTVAQKVRLHVPSVTGVAFGMTEMDGLEVTILNTGDADADGITNTITVDVDSSGFTAFAWPLTTDPAFTPAQVVPIGENTAIALNNPLFPANSGISPYGDATNNIGKFGVVLMNGAGSPAGVTGNVITWIAYKSFNT